MGTDEDIDFPLGHLLQNLVLLSATLEATDRLDPDGPLRHPFTESDQMLLGENRGRYQYRDLLAPLHRLERGPHRQLCFSVTDISANETVHRLRFFHVTLDRFHGVKLVTGLVVGERFIEGGDSGVVFRKGMARSLRSDRLHLEQLCRQIVDRFLGTGLLLRPQRAADLVELARSATATHILLYQINPVHRHQQGDTLGKFENQKVSLACSIPHRAQSLIAGDTVGHMDDQLSFLQLEEVVDRPTFDPLAGFLLLSTAPATKGGMPTDKDAAAIFMPAETGGELAHSNAHSRTDVRFCQNFPESLPLRFLPEEDDDLFTTIGDFCQCRNGSLQRTLIAIGGNHRQLKRTMPGFGNQRIQLQADMSSGSLPESLAQLLAVTGCPLSNQKVHPLFHLFGIPHRNDGSLGQGVKEQALGSGPTTDKP